MPLCAGEEGSAAGIYSVSHEITINIFHVVLNIDDIVRVIENRVSQLYLKKNTWW